jgi:hypothetical protein
MSVCEIGSEREIPVSVRIQTLGIQFIIRLCIASNLLQFINMLQIIRFYLCGNSQMYYYVSCLFIIIESLIAKGKAYS